MLPVSGPSRGQTLFNQRRIDALAALGVDVAEKPLVGTNQPWPVLHPRLKPRSSRRRSVASMEQGWPCSGVSTPNSRMVPMELSKVSPSVTPSTSTIWQSGQRSLVATVTSCGQGIPTFRGHVLEQRTMRAK